MQSLLFQTKKELDFCQPKLIRQIRAMHARSILHYAWDTFAILLSTKLDGNQKRYICFSYTTIFYAKEGWLHIWGSLCWSGERGPGGLDTKNNSRASFSLAINLMWSMLKVGYSNCWTWLDLITFRLFYTSKQVLCFW